MLGPQDIQADVPDIVALPDNNQCNHQQLAQRTSVASSSQPSLPAPLNSAVIVKTRHSTELSPSKGMVAIRCDWSFSAYCYFNSQVTVIIQASM